MYFLEYSFYPCKTFWPHASITSAPSPVVAKRQYATWRLGHKAFAWLSANPWLAPLPCITLSSDRTCRPCRAPQTNSGHVNKMLRDKLRMYYNWPQQQCQHRVGFLSTILSPVVGVETEETHTHKPKLRHRNKATTCGCPVPPSCFHWNKHIHRQTHTCWNVTV